MWLNLAFLRLLIGFWPHGPNQSRSAFCNSEVWKRRPPSTPPSCAEAQRPKVHFSWISKIVCDKITFQFHLSLNLLKYLQLLLPLALCVKVGGKVMRACGPQNVVPNTGSSRESQKRPALPHHSLPTHLGPSCLAGSKSSGDLSEAPGS